MNKKHGSRPATLRDVAAAAQTSVASASRALTGHPYVRSSVKERVEAAAAALGYRPNESARSLRTSRTMTFGLLCFQLRQLPLLDFIDGFEAGAETAGYTVLVANARGDDAHYQTLARRLFERRVDGLVVTSPGDLGDSLSPFAESAVPALLTLWRPPGADDLPLVTFSELNAARQAMARLRELGHSSLVHFATPRTLFMTRPSVLAQAALENRISCEVVVVPETTEVEAMAKTIRQAMSDPLNATVMALNYSLVGATLGAARQLGLKIPRDVSVMTLAGYEPTDALLEFPLASIHTDVFELGRQSAEILTLWIDSGSSPPSVTELHLSNWVEAASVGPRPTAAV